MRVAVYTIALNEEKHAARFMETASEADVVLVADTGSTDRTTEILREHGASVYDIRIKPWRFDDARNAALALIPHDVDVCVVVDMDEVLDRGWCERLKSEWTEGTTRGRYLYVWNHNPDGSPGVSFWADRVHSRHGFRWVHPVHETLTSDRTDEHFVWLSYELHHWADDSKPRSQYLPLLEVAHHERPNDPRTAHYLGREYMFYSMWDKAEVSLKKHLSMPESSWRPERAASMRYLARCVQAQGRMEEAFAWFRSACNEEPSLREGWVEYAQACYGQQMWGECYKAVERALALTERPPSYLSEPWAWGSLPADIGSISAWNLGLHDRAVELAEMAVQAAPTDERIANNLTFFRSTRASMLEAGQRAAEEADPSD